VYDVVIVGSGAAGSVLAARLAARGLTVGARGSGRVRAERYQDATPTRPRPHDELGNVLCYYKDAGLQLTDGTCRMSVVQDSAWAARASSTMRCAFACLRTSATRGRAASAPAGPSTASWMPAYDRIAAELGIEPVTSAVPEGWINASVALPRQRASALGRADALRACDVNVKACLGCGYCNLACAYLRKRTVLQDLLPPRGLHRAAARLHRPPCAGRSSSAPRRIARKRS
jgi:hypothetical protein